MALINIKKQSDSIKQAAIDAIHTIFPVSKKKHELLLNRVWIESPPNIDDFTSQAKAKSKGNSWGASVFVDLTLRDKLSKKVLDREKKIKLFLLPELTARASYIVKGNEYQVANQLRLKSGAYVKQMKGGGFKTQINLSKGKIKPDILISPKGILQLKMYQGTVDLMPLLKGLGISEDQLKNSWGKIAYEQNLSSKLNPQAAVKKFAEKVFKGKVTNVETARDKIKSFMKEKTAILPSMTKLTLGRAHNHLSPELLLDASAKLIKVNTGVEEHDDVDNLAFKEFFSVDDSIKERIEKNKNSIMYKISRNLDTRDKIRQIITLGTFGTLIESFFTEDDRSATTEQINPLHMYAGHEKVTFLGPGALSSTQTATEETQNVHPTHLSFLDPVHTPESDRIGLNLGLTITAEKVGKDLKATFFDVKKKKSVTLTPFEVYNKHLAYPDQWDNKTDKFKKQKVKVQIKGKLKVVDKSKVDYVMTDPQFAFSLSTNMIPFMASDNGNRTMMAGKHMEQAISLENREAPLVQNKMPNLRGKTFEGMLGESFAIYATTTGAKQAAPINGKVKKITKDSISIQSGKELYKIQLYKNFVLNQKTFLNHELKVKVGDTVKGGQLLADSNYSKEGTLALGRNLKTAYIPYKGYNFEDGIVITESAAKKLTSGHIHKKEMSLSKTSILNMGKFRSNFPNIVTTENLKKLDEGGVIRKGSKVSKGDILIATLRDTGSVAGLEAIKATFDKSLGSRYKSKVETWTSDHDGVVTEVNKSRDRISVYVKTSESATIGDKLAGRHGNKGIITKIIPDAQAPHNADGDAVDIMLNPHGVISRINIGQMYESAIGKVAKKKGKTYVVDNFSGENYLQSVKDELKKNGVDDSEELFDPETEKSLGKVHVGDPYILKLNKQSTVNFSVRGESGPTAKSTLQPIRGGTEGAKAIDLLTMYSMLSHGATANLKEMTTYKSENNPEFWEAIKFGRPIPAPKTPFVFDKMVTMLKGAGVDVTKDGSKLSLAPLTDAQIKKLSKMKIVNPGFYRASGKTMKLTKGGFLDPTHIGGADGANWSHIKLKEPMPSPVFEHAIKLLLNMVDSDYKNILSGEKTIRVKGQELTSGKALIALLSQIDVDKSLKEIEPTLNSLRGAKLDNATKKFRLLNALKTNGMTPVEAYIRKNVAVIPPKFRPISILDSGDLTVDTSNFLYRNVAAINKQMGLPVVDMLADEDLKEVRTELYDNLKALAGLHEIKTGARDKVGFIKTLHGSQPKTGFYQYKVLRKNQNLVGRGTIIPEPKLHMDDVALPEDMAWKLYGPFIIKELIRHGMMAKQAQLEIDNRSPRAKRALDIAMDKRPVMLNRAPSLHKFSMMAFNPKITTGKAIKIPPLVVNGYNADFNGDSCVRQTLINVSYKPLNASHSVELCNTIEEIFTQITGKKVSEMITDAKGFTAIYEIPLGSVKTRGLVNGTIKETDIQRLTVHTSHGPCYKVETNTGTQGVFSEHHNFSYINDRFEMSAIKTEDMATELLIPKVNMELAWKNVNKYQITKIGRKELIVDEDMAYMFGFYAGDGHVSDRRKTGRGMDIGFTDTEGTLLNYMEDIVESYGFKKGNRQGTSKHKKCKAMFYSVELGSWLIEHVGKGFDKKKVPTMIFNSPLSVRKSFVYGVLEAEGNICTDGNDKKIIRLEMNNDIFIRQLRILMNTCGIHSFLSETFLKDKIHKAWKLIISKTSWVNLLDMKNAPKANLIKQANNLRKATLKIEREVYDIVPLSEQLIEEVSILGHKLKTLSKSDKAILKSWRTTHVGRKISFIDHLKNKKDITRKYMSRPMALNFIHTYGAFVKDGSLFKKWSNIVEDTSTQWEIVEKITEVPRELVLFDFTVPEGETFCIDNGLITHNTMTVHVPLTDKAVRESYKMMPSRNLYKPGVGSLMVGPSQESQLGFYLLTKDAAGRSQLNKILPKKFHIKGVLNKGASKALFLKLSKELPREQFSVIIDTIKVMGENAAYEKGFTLRLKDLSIVPGRDKIIDMIEAEAKKLNAGKLTPKAFSDKVLGKGGFQDKLDKLIELNLKDKDNALYEMVNSGARGNKGQLRQITGSPLLVQDPRGNIIPQPIRKSFSEGLDLSEYWTAAYGARKGMMDRAKGTQEPGVFNKSLMAVAVNNVISMEDCGTTEGVQFSVNSRDILGRYLQGSQGRVDDETIIGEEEIKKFKKAKLKTVKVRSPLKCKAANGTCRHCYGADENGSLVDIGANIGAKAGQSMAEPLTQLTMNTFHSGGIAGTGQKEGYTRIKELMDMPQNIKVGKAVLADETGIVSKIKPSGVGGYNVQIGLKNYVTSPHLKLKFKVGQTIRKGDPLTEGSVSPQELLAHKGVPAVQDYLTSELKNAYGSQGIDLDSKTFETIVRSLTNRTQVINNIPNLPYIPGDSIPYTVAAEYNKNRKIRLSPTHAYGHILDKPIAGLEKGLKLGSKEIKLLEGLGIPELDVEKEKLKHQPYLKGIRSLPLSSNDWLAQMGATRIKDAVLKGASQGWMSDVKGYHPIPAFAYGASFGDGDEGKY